MQCPSCGCHVSASAATCAVCGAILARGAAFAGSGRLTSASTVSTVATRAPEAGPAPCPACGASLEHEARFCSDCGATTQTGEYASPPLPDEPLDEPEVVRESEVVRAVTAPQEEYVPVEDDVVVVPAELEREAVEDRAAAEDRVAPMRAPDRTGPVPVLRPVAPPVVRAPQRGPERTPLSAEDAWAWVTPAAAAFAVFALLVAMLVHLFAPSTLPDYSAAELSLKIQMRAVEWLLAGTLIGIVGLLAKR
jgi:hypothetical protein